MRAVHVLLLLALICQALAQNPFLSRASHNDDDDDDGSGSGKQRFGGSGSGKQRFGGKSSGGDDDDDDSGQRKLPFTSRPRGTCGGLKQICCPNSQCAGSLKCLAPGDSNWVGMNRRCLPLKVRGRCGTDGLQCCRGRCIRGLTCAGRKMCRKPADSMLPSGVTGTTTTQLSGWILVKVLARGGKCFVRVIGDINASVMTFGEGTFGETFGDLSALGECTDNASGFGIGYIRADVMGTATLTDDGRCITDSTSNIQLGGNVQGTGISVTLDGDAGTNVGCLKRRLLLSDFL